MSNRDRFEHDFRAPRMRPSLRALRHGRRPPVDFEHEKSHGLNHEVEDSCLLNSFERVGLAASVPWK